MQDRRPSIDTRLIVMVSAALAIGIVLLAVAMVPRSGGDGFAPRKMLTQVEREVKDLGKSLRRASSAVTGRIWGMSPAQTGTCGEGPLDCCTSIDN